MRRLGIYLHIPFYVQKCLYCDFCSLAGANKDEMSAYVAELCRRISAERDRLSTCEIDTVYFGGGTPTLLAPKEMQKIFDVLDRCCHLSENCEITCECNPATADREKFSALRTLGINRLSIGLQSVQGDELRRLGRIHSYEDFLVTFKEARSVGFDNISVDLMYALPDQTLSSWEESLLRVAKEVCPEHLSVYGLKLEEGTPFFAARDRLTLPDEETELSMYLECSEILEYYGYHKYEISNFAKNGYASRHNLRYWHGEEYLGFGVAAYSFFEGKRFGNSRDLSAFLRGEDIVEECVSLTERDELNEYLMLRLRLCEGIDERELFARFGVRLSEIAPSLENWIFHGFLQRSNGRISFTDRGFFVSNAILSELLDYDEKNC